MVTPISVIPRNPFLRRTSLLVSLITVFAGLSNPEQATAVNYWKKSSAVVLSIQSGVFYEGCVEHPYQYTVAPPVGTDSWSMTVVAVGPDGLDGPSDFVYDSLGVGEGELLFCGGLAGQYSLVAEIEYHDYDQSVGGISTEVITTQFTMRNRYTRTRLNVAPRSPGFNDAVTFKIKSLEERPAGFFASEFAWVRLQAKVKGKWGNVRTSKALTNGRGLASLTFRWDVDGSATFRAITLADEESAASQSDPVRVQLAEGSSPVGPFWRVDAATAARQLDCVRFQRTRGSRSATFSAGVCWLEGSRVNVITFRGQGQQSEWNLLAKIAFGPKFHWANGVGIVVVAKNGNLRAARVGAAAVHGEVEHG